MTELTKLWSGNLAQQKGSQTSLVTQLISDSAKIMHNESVKLGNNFVTFQKKTSTAAKRKKKITIVPLIIRLFIL